MHGMDVVFDDNQPGGYLADDIVKRNTLRYLTVCSYVPFGALEGCG